MKYFAKPAPPQGWTVPPPPVLRVVECRPGDSCEVCGKNIGRYRRAVAVQTEQKTSRDVAVQTDIAGVWYRVTLPAE
ncbi:hypothetical protein ACOMHN_001766 [Nucella lapillus]